MLYAAFSRITRKLPRVCGPDDVGVDTIMGKQLCVAGVYCGLRGLSQDVYGGQPVAQQLGISRNPSPLGPTKVEVIRNRLQPNYAVGYRDR